MSTTPIDQLLTRRSIPVKDLAAPIPNAEEIELILRAATRVPDHGKLTPWRIKILHAEGQRKLGEIAAQQFAMQYPAATPQQLAHEQNRFTRAPLVLAVIHQPVFGAKPVWEQQLSTGAVCMNMLHAVHLLGYGAKWLTEWVAYDAAICAALGGAPDDKIAGFIYIGTKTITPEDRERPKLEDIVSEYR